ENPANMCSMLSLLNVKEFQSYNNTRKIFLTTNLHLSYTNNKYAMNEVFGMKTSFIAWFVFNSC
ncbi:MAG: hypothetical protein WCP55_14535, partial [Lentisphaerota bacterium]